MINMKPTTAKYVSSVYLFIFLMMFLCSNSVFCQKKFTVQYILSGKDTAYKLQQPDLVTVFDTKQRAVTYLNSLPAALLSKGFAAASVDSIMYDSTSARVVLYLGIQYKWVKINTDSIDQEVLSNIGWHEKEFDNKEIDFSRLQLQQERIVNYYENSGYPFA